MVVPHSGGYPHAKFEGNLLLFKFGPHTKSGLTIPQCARSLGPSADESDTGKLYLSLQRGEQRGHLHMTFVLRG